MSGVNKVILLGRLGGDPEVTTLKSGQVVAKFALATSKSYKDKKGKKGDTTQWHNIVMWQPLAQVAEKYLSKGSLVYLEGELTSRSYDDQQGNKRWFTEIVAHELTMLGGNNKNQESENSTILEEPNTTPWQKIIFNNKRLFKGRIQEANYLTK